MARPTKYNQEIVTKAQHYLENYQEYDDVIPSLAGLALVLGLSRETLRLWSKDEDKKEFFGILDRINQKQECVLINNGLNGTFNSNIAKLVLGKHGYHDRPQQDGTQVQVIINRDRVVLKSGEDTLAIEDS
jgi:molybdopterin-guanine dinucleotide biosynthesis protein